MSILPSGYKRLLYIESSGTQYVDCGISVPHATARTVVDFEVTTTDATQVVTGHMDGAFSWATNFLYLYKDNRFAVNNYVPTDFTASVGSRFLIDYTNKSLEINGKSYPVTQRSYTDGYNDAIFYSTDFPGKFKLYSYKLYDGETIVRNYIPAESPDGVIGLYDTVNGTFNAGVGVFIAGPEWGYIELEYIQSSGTQWVDTDFIPNSNTRVVFDFQETVFTSNTWRCMFGSRNNSSNVNVFAIWVSNSNVLSAYYNNSGTQFPTSVVSVQRLLIDFNKEVVTIGNQTVNSGVKTFSSSYPLFLFASNTAGSMESPISGKLYSCQIYDNGTLIRDYIPIKLIDGTVGLLDKLTEEFYPNMGTGTFVAGQAIATEYTRLEYVDNSAGQYIDTGFLLNQNSRVVMDIEVTEAPSNQAGFFGARHSQSSSSVGFLLWYFGSYPFRSDWGGTTLYITTDLTGRYQIDHNKSVLNINGLTIEHTAKTFQVEYTAYLFAVNGGGSLNYGIIPGKLYSCQIYDNDVLVHDYIPINNRHGAVGLLDDVTGYFYTGETDVAFVAGPEIIDIEPTITPKEFTAPYADFSNILLMWKSSPYAEGYNLYRDRELIATTAAPVFFDGGLELQTEYTYEVTAFNKSGESESIEITASTTEFKLITDRTNADVQAVLAAINTGVLPENWFSGLKGAYNATDLNRVESAVLFVIERLRIAGWYLAVQSKHWTMTDFPTASEMRRYLENVRLLRSALPVGIPAVPADMDRLTFAEANTIEQILEMLDAAVTNIMANVYYSNELYSGEV